MYCQFAVPFRGTGSTGEGSGVQAEQARGEWGTGSKGEGSGVQAVKARGSVIKAVH